MLSLLLLCALPAVSLALLVGGMTDVQLAADDASVLFALSSINSFYNKLGDANVRQLVTVEKAQSQAVQGNIYYLTLRVSSGSQEELCMVNVWSRPWLSGDDAMQITKEPACKPVTDVATSMSLLWGDNSIDSQSAEVMKALDFAVQSLNAQENYIYKRKAVSIGKVTPQVVSGISYHFYGVDLAATDCTKSSNLPLSSCNVTDGDNTRTCDFDVLWQSWMTPEYKLIHINCNVKVS